MMSKHTPGPWKAVETRVYFPNLAGGFDIYKCPNPEANARLIAAAPDLLGAAKAVTGMLELFADYNRINESADGIDRQSADAFRKLADLRAAIAKAEAE